MREGTLKAEARRFPDQVFRVTVIWVWPTSARIGRGEGVGDQSARRHRPVVVSWDLAGVGAELLVEPSIWSMQGGRPAVYRVLADGPLTSTQVVYLRFPSGGGCRSQPNPRRGCRTRCHTGRADQDVRRSHGLIACGAGSQEALNRERADSVLTSEQRIEMSEGSGTRPARLRTHTDTPSSTPGRSSRPSVAPTGTKRPSVIGHATGMTWTVQRARRDSNPQPSDP